MNYLDLLQHRFACKEFDGRKIPQHILDAILQAGILSPSSLGLEPWMFYVLSNKEDILKLSQFCNSKKQFQTCSHAIIIASKNSFKPTEASVVNALGRRGDFESILQVYAPFLERLEKRNAHEYGALQAYIAATNMINCAYTLGVDSCWIGGYDEEPINDCFLPGDEFCATVLTFGYRLNEPKRAKLRFSYNEKVKFL